ncbi:MAG: EamA family transporter RarD [Pseudomonadota bacterium]
MGFEARTGFFAALAAYVIWGSLPLYFRALDHIRPDELLAHRVLWSVPTGLAFVAIAASWPTLARLLTWKTLGWLCLSAVLIGVNWMLYIWSVSAERVMEAALGYYINPLVNVLFGMVFFGERLRWAQWGSVALATCGVILLAAAFGRPPWIALVLCFTFALYTVVRKHIEVDGRAGFVVEAALLSPFAAVWLGYMVGAGEIGPMGRSAIDIPWILASGPITAVPLILFTIAAQRLSLSAIGMMQYLAPTLQFATAVLLFDEPFSRLHAAAFSLIWIALAIFTSDSVLGNAKARRLARAARLT